VTAADELQGLRAENARLQARVAELERELGEQAAAANAAVAAAQDRAYWLDRARIDLNAVMLTPAGRALQTLLRALRALRRRA
jgi:cell division septum initiation protein DivIVA